MQSDEEKTDEFEEEMIESTSATEDWDDDFTASRIGGGKYKAKGYSTLIVFLLWVAFVIIWLFFFAEPYGPFENLGIILATFFLLGGLVGAAWYVQAASCRVSGRLYAVWRNWYRIPPVSQIVS